MKTRQNQVHPEKRRAIQLLHAAGMTVSQISRVTSVSRPTVYSITKAEEAVKTAEEAVKTAEEGVDNDCRQIDSSEVQGTPPNSECLGQQSG